MGTGRLIWGRRVALAASLVALLGMGTACDRSSGPRLQFTRPFEFKTPITIGKETRLGSGPVFTTELEAVYHTVGELPRRLLLRPLLAKADGLVLHYKAWRPGRRLVELGQATVSVEVKRSGGRASVELQGLRQLVRSFPAKVRIRAWPMGGQRIRHHLASAVVVPPGGVLGFGYGLRQESWFGDVPGATFGVSVQDSTGKVWPVFSRSLDPRRRIHRGWFAEAVDLSRWAGRKVTVALDTKAIAPGAFSLAAWSEPVLYSRGERTARPNLIVVSVDTLRAQDLGCYGYGRDTSPFIDTVAGSGTLFERAITTSVTTGPSHMSLFTGLYPPKHRVLTGIERKASGVTTVTTLLREAGYYTAAFTEDGFIIREHGFGEGFDQYTENRGRTIMSVPGEARLTFSQARGWLTENAVFPFFLFVHTYQVHSPYNPPAPYDSLFRQDQAPKIENSKVRDDLDNYDREIRLVDHELRNLFLDLRTRGLAEETVVVILADHGEEFGEHGFLQHGGAVFDETLRIPLIMWGPRWIPGRQVIKGQVSLVDVGPTLLELAGVDIPAGLDGISLKQAMDEGRQVAPRTLFAEARGPRRTRANGHLERWNPPLIAVTSNNMKIILHRPRRGKKQPVVAYDLVNDPKERKPIAPAPQHLREVENMVDDYLKGITAGETLMGSRPPESTAFTDPEIRERLRLLGYID